MTKSMIRPVETRPAPCRTEKQDEVKDHAAAEDAGSPEEKEMDGEAAAPAEGEDEDEQEEEEKQVEKSAPWGGGTRWKGRRRDTAS